MNGELAISKKGLITIRGGNYTTSGGFDDRVDRGQATGTYYDVFATVFSRDATPSKACKISSYPRSGSFVNDLNNGFFDAPNYFAPAVSRRLYNGKRAFMFHNIANNGELKYYFKTLSNTITSHDNRLTPDERMNYVQVSDFGEYTPEKFSDAAKGFAEQVYGTGVMEVKGYENEIFVVAAGVIPHVWQTRQYALNFSLSVLTMQAI